MAHEGSKEVPHPGQEGGQQCWEPIQELSQRSYHPGHLLYTEVKRGGKWYLFKEKWPAELASRGTVGVSL